MRTIQNIAYADTNNERQLLDLYLPETENFKTFVYFHGGGLESGSKGECIDEFAGLIDKNIAVARVNYRLYPFAQFPDFIRDCAASLAWVKDHIKEYGGSDTIFAGGSSVGGYIAMMLYFDKKYLAPFQLSPNDFAGFVFDAGQPTTHFNVLRERGEDPRRVIIDDCAPIFHINDYSGEPPVLVIVSDDDMQNRYEQTQLLLSTMNHFGYPKENIAFQLMENSEHCSYCSQPIFAQMIYDFIEKRNAR